MSQIDSPEARLAHHRTLVSQPIAYTLFTHPIAFPLRKSRPNEEEARGAVLAYDPFLSDKSIHQRMTLAAKSARGYLGPGKGYRIFIEYGDGKYHRGQKANGFMGWAAGPDIDGPHFTGWT